MTLPCMHVQVINKKVGGVTLISWYVVIIRAQILLYLPNLVEKNIKGNGLYDGTASENLLREGLGTCGVDNREEYYSDSWEDDKPHGYGYNLKKSWFTY
ncbi:unnamed protein product [Rotaria socialis]|uniref:Uncharacterized protein n=1 Tax=Rotaria socialis TaxID=392032 RepID=A0A817SDH4_9BILA|nr:unnamed protein product [Rotaria socialis]CAF3511749.1 unnamed protein product [Rotaria socialis]CAF4467438.1 unnamed protein product [Rotaria socialis]CAF4474854.1 unnamed protein product [Rotaria socialis]CAF4718703.1 unnamed protein product [Rotaria socialis]